MGDRLSWISSHHALFLLKNCFTLPKLLYILRTSPCFAHPLLQSFDDLQIYLLRSLLNIRLDDRASQQASLPVRFGGIGIIKATSIASSAYISSKLSCVELEASLLPDNLSLPPSPGDLHHAFTNWKACSNTARRCHHLPVSETGLWLYSKILSSHSSAPLLTLRMRPGFWLVHKRSQVHGWRPYQFPPWGSISAIMS